MKLAIQHFESTFETERESFCSEICRLEGECSRISVEQPLKSLWLSDVCQPRELLMIVKPELEIPGILPIWNSLRCVLSLREKFL
jgi:hypothetical protein